IGPPKAEHYDGYVARKRRNTLAVPVDADNGFSQDDGRLSIRITTKEHQVNDQAVAALGNDLDLYQRGGVLVRIIRDSSRAARGIRRPSSPRTEPLPAALLRERLTATARWLTLKVTGDGEQETEARPPAWCVAAVHARADWPTIRHLEAVVDYPVI